MRELWDLARQYGSVDLFTNEQGKYSCVITFHTIEHTELKARSGYGFEDPEECLKAAIKAAQKIVNTMSQKPPIATAEWYKKLIGSGKSEA